MSLRAARCLAALALPALAMAACSESDDVTLEPVTDDAGFTVTLEEQGDEPHHELRLDPAVGDTDEVTQVQETSFEITVGGQTQSSTSPPVEIDFGYEVVDVGDDQIELRGTYDDVRVDATGADPRLVEELRTTLDGFRGATARTVFTPRGSILEADIEGLEIGGAGGAMLEQMAASFSDSAASMSMPFPVDPVGAGARWRVEAETELGGLPMELTTVIELDEVDDERATGTVEQTLVLVPGDVQLLGTPATVVGGELTGTGTIEWDLADGLVPRSDITTTGTSVLESAGTRVEQDQEQRIAIRSR